MWNRLATITLVIVVCVLGFWYYWWNIAQPQIPKSTNGIEFKTQRSLIDPASFTREESLAALKNIEVHLSSESKFANYVGVDANLSSINLSQLPSGVAMFVLPAPNEKVESKASLDGKYYYAHYFSEIALPENHPRIVRLLNPKEFNLLTGTRGPLASVIEFESESYYIRVTQLTVSEERTEVTVHALKK